MGRAYVGGQSDAGGTHHDNARPTVAFDHIALNVYLRAARHVVADARVALEYAVDHVDYSRQPGFVVSESQRAKQRNEQHCQSRERLVLSLLLAEL